MNIQTASPLHSKAFSLVQGNCPHCLAGLGGQAEAARRIALLRLPGMAPGMVPCIAEPPRRTAVWYDRD